MKNQSFAIFLAIIMVFFIGQNSVLAAEPGQPIYKEGEILVKYKDPALGQSLKTIQLSADQDLDSTLTGFRRNDNVEYAERVLLRQMAKTPNDPYYEYYQWHLNQANGADINAPQAWEKTTGQAGTVVAVIDSGVDLDHPDLQDNIWTNSDEIPSNGVDDDGNGYIDDYYGWDFVDNDNDPNPYPDGLDNDGDGYIDYGAGHGTHVAGLIAAKGNNSVGVSGVCWNCQIMVLQVLSDEGWGDSAGIASAINYAAANGADVINMSLGSYGYSTAEYYASEDALDQGVVIVAAVGNDSLDLSWYPNYPSCYDGVIGVTATDSYDYPAYFSNYGSACADIAAPGDYIYSTYLYDYDYGYYYYYGYMSGTSMASPIVAGAAALMRSYDSTASVNKIRNTLIDNAKSVSTISSDYGSGRLNINKALAELKDNQSPTAPAAISAYTKSDQAHSINSNTRTAEKSPYFAWPKGTDNKKVAGYYVYWGAQAKANPQTKGAYQTKRYLSKSKIRGNEKIYYLRIKSKDTSDNVSSTVQFKYLVDNKAKKPYSLTVVDKSGGVKVSWKCQENHVKRYNIYRRKVNKDDSVGNWKKVNSVAVTVKSYLDASASSGQRYQYRIEIKDTLNNTAFSQASSTIKHRL